MDVGASRIISILIPCTVGFASLLVATLAFSGAADNACRNGKVESWVGYGAVPGQPLGFSTVEEAVRSAEDQLEVSDGVDVTGVVGEGEGALEFLLIKGEETVGGFMVAATAEGRYLPNGYFVCTGSDGEIPEPADLGFDPAV
jgi:hypothetical protein